MGNNDVGKVAGAIYGQGKTGEYQLTLDLIPELKTETERRAWDQQGLGL